MKISILKALWGNISKVPFRGFRGKAPFRGWGVVGVFCLLLLPSCNKFLDITPTGEVIPETIEEYRSLLVQAYSTMSTRNTFITTFRTDEIDMSTATTQDRDSYEDIWTWRDADPRESTIPFEWEKFYYVIYIANWIIENEDRITNGTQAEVDQVVGEALMIRAYVHFMLTNMYGAPYGPTAAADKAVPIKRNTNTEEVLPRNTVAEVYDFIEKELDKAEKRLNVSEWELGKNYRFNTLSVDAFRSRLFLYKKDWPASLAASKRVLALKDTLADLNNPKEDAPSHFKSPESIVALEYLIDNYRVGRVNIELINRYRSGDRRKAKYYEAQTPSNYSLLKSGSAHACTFRMGELYFNAAEAEYQLDHLDEAKKWLLSLLEKRYNATVYKTVAEEVNALGKEDFIQYLYEERFKEFAFEGHRWFDLRRTTQQRLEKKLGATTYVLEQGDVRYTLRIPTEAILSNPGLAN